MKRFFLHKFLLVGILIMSSFLYAQEANITKEEKGLEFQTYFFEALKQTAINNYSKAIESLEKCYQIDASNLAVEFEFSKNYLLDKKYFEAEIFIDKALNKEPKNPYLLSHKVAIFKAQSSFDKAIDIQKELVKIKPTYSDDLVLLYIQNQNFDAAENLITFIEENGLKTPSIKGYKQFLLSRKTPIIVEQIETEITNGSINIEELRQKYLKNIDYTLLQEILTKEYNSSLYSMLYSDSKEGLDLFPAQPFLYKMNAIALNKLEKYNDAITVLTIGIDFVIDNNDMEAEFYEQLSISYFGLGDKNEAIKYEQKAKKLRN